MSYDTQYRPQLGHWTENYVLFQDGSLGTTFHVAGQNSELMDEAALISAREIINQTALSTTHPRLQWWEHFTRIGGQKAPPLQPNPNWWGQTFDDAVSRNCMGNLYRNDLFFTLIMRPRSDIAVTLMNIWHRTKTFVTKAPTRNLPSAAAAFLEDIDNTAAKTMNNLASFGIRQLGFRVENDVWFSEVWEAHHLIGNGFFRPIPACNGADRAGRQVIPTRPVFGHQEYRLLTEGPEQWGAILTLNAYPGLTHPLMHDRVRSARFDCTITNSYYFKQTQTAINKLASKQRQMNAAGDSPRQAKEVQDQKENLQSSLTAYGRHHFSLTIRGHCQDALGRSVWEGEGMVAKGGATITRCDSKTLKAAFHAQFPGNGKWRTRRGGIPSLNFASFAALNNTPTGPDRSRWGGPLFYLRTTNDTIYPYHLQVIGDPNIPKEDVGSWTTTGGMGSGKTAHNARKAQAGARVGARSIIFDKDCGLAPVILASDGEYFVLEDGQDSGVSLLRGLEDTPDDKAFIHQALLGLIESDGQKGILSSEDTALGEQIEFQMSLPVHLRSIDGIWPLLGSVAEGAGPRLRKWGRSGRLGWAFDGLTDRVNPYAKMLGFDTTSLLKNPLVCEPMLTLLFYRIQKIIYHRKPLIIMLDECWQTIGKNELTGASVDNKRFVGVFNDISKTIRKNEGCIGLITQSPDNLLTSAMSSTIIQNFPTKEFFGDRSASAKDLVEGFSLTPRELHIVKHVLPAMRHAVLIHRSSGSFIARNDMGGIPDKVSVLSGRRSTYDLCLALRNEYGNEPQRWVPHYERLAPKLVDNPHLDVMDLIHGRTQFVKEMA